MANKYYAVKKGHNVGIFTSWLECEKQVKNYPGAIFKSFQSEAEAKKYLYEGKANNIEDTDFQGIKIYVDGSYSKKDNLASYGFVVIKDDEEIYRDYKAFIDNDNIWNVAGELEGVITATNWAMENKYKDIAIYYDYQGIESWAKGEWKANLNKTKSYQEFIKNISREINIRFVKVQAHSGMKYNELADELAKKAIAEKVER